MAGYKRLKSVAHNVAHSFLSLMNYVDDDHIVEDIFQTARSAGADHVVIDLMSGAVEPISVATPRVRKSIQRTRKWLPRQAAAEGCDPEAIRSFTLEIDFRFDQTRESEYLPGLQLPSYQARGVIIENRGVRHVGVVPEWWRYG